MQYFLFLWILLFQHNVNDYIQYVHYFDVYLPYKPSCSLVTVIDWLSTIEQDDGLFN